MRCPRCGAALAVGAAVCGRCGMGVAPWGAASAHTQPSRAPGGLPVTHYAPSAYGPPVDSDRELPVVTLVEADAETRRAIGYRPVELPPPLPHGRGGRKRLALVCGIVLLAVLAATVALAHGGIGFGPSPIGHRGGSSSTPLLASATAIPACPVRSVNPSAAKLLAHSQLTTGVRNAAKKDYRPVDDVTTFTTHQTVYLTFVVATSQAGTVNAIFCAPGMQAQGRLTIPAHSAGRYAEFAMVPGDANVGQATATILWNGAVAASLPFTITQ